MEGSKELVSGNIGAEGQYALGFRGRTNQGET